MARKKTPVIDVPAAPARPIPAGMFKCGDCGKTLPSEAEMPGWPPEWRYCINCSKRRYDVTPWSNPLGPSALDAGPQHYRPGLEPKRPGEPY